MKYCENLVLQVRVLDNSTMQVRRIDGKPVTQKDREEAQRLADSSAGITVADIMRVFPGSRVIEPKDCLTK